MAKKEASCLDAHKPIESIILSGWVITEAGGSQFDPVTLVIADSLLAIKCFAHEVTIASRDLEADEIKHIPDGHN